MLSLAKNPLFAMIDTETIYFKKRVYELAIVVFDSVTCAIVDSKKWYIRETVESALFYQLRHNKQPIFWPNRLNPFQVLKDAVTWEEALNEFMIILARHDVNSLIAHNINFDVNAIYATNTFYGSEDTQYQAFLSNFNKLELSGYFIHGLPLMAAYNVPYKYKSGCMTFKADYLSPCLVGTRQNHDAIGDCMNQIELYKLTRGKYQNQGTIYANMLAHHALKHDDNKRLGNSSLD